MHDEPARREDSYKNARRGRSFLEAVACPGKRQRRGKIRERRAYVPGPAPETKRSGEFNRRLIQQSILHPEHQHTPSQKRRGDAANKIGKSRMSSRRGSSSVTTLSLYLMGYGKNRFTT